jgi:hypothetical protein
MKAGAGRTWRKRPSGAMVVAIGAVVLAAVGTAIADPLASTSKLTKKDKKQVRAISTGVVNSLAAGLSVANAQTAGSAQTAQSAQTAATAANAANATNATNAGNADTLDGLDFTQFVPSSAVIRIPTTQMVDDQTHNAVDVGNIEVIFQCEIDDAGQDVVFVEVNFGTAGSLVFGGTTEIGFAGDVFPVFQQTHPATGDDRMTQEQVTIVADEGTMLTGTMWAAFNLAGTTDRCFVGGHVIRSG